jgi:hypothetical protein
VSSLGTSPSLSALNDCLAVPRRAGRRQPVLRTIAEPPEAKARLASGYHAAFRGAYAVAAAQLGGGPGNPPSDDELARRSHDNAVTAC